MNWTKAFVLTVLALTTFSCTHERETRKDSAGVSARNIRPEVTADNFLSGRQFCAYYSNHMKNEHGRYIRVPKDYNNPGAGTLEIYAWTSKPFDPSLSSFVHISGGPGQNSHTL